MSGNYLPYATYLTTKLTMTTHVCAACGTPLTFVIEAEESDNEGIDGAVSVAASSSAASMTETILDDVELPYGCHFHWFAAQGLESDID